VSQKEVYEVLLLVTFLLFCSTIGGAVLGIVTYPSVTIELVPVSRRVSITAQLPLLPTRTLAPLTLTTSATAPTTGKEHQDARRATGTLTLYSGLFTAQQIAAGTVFTARDGVQVATDAAVILPPGNPPSYGQATVPAHALHAGPAGNIAAGEITTTLGNGVLVKNSRFGGGQAARAFHAVAHADLDGLTSLVRSTLTQRMPQAFPLAPGESVLPTHCAFRATPTQQVGAEATTVSVHATLTCAGLAYHREQLAQQATTLFRTQTAPGAPYQLVGTVQVQLVSGTPLTVLCHGLWIYTLSQDYQQLLAQQLAGDNQAQAREYLLATGFITRATVPAVPLPKDPAHIHFETLIGV
jgi:Baseplate J-like protein